jgi:hypothetical protein
LYAAHYYYFFLLQIEQNIPQEAEWFNIIVPEKTPEYNGNDLKMARNTQGFPRKALQ